tara:strand:+ start:127 stop:510 length:384 start_codon:yes stop_codon:yes gene_type:complete
MNTILVILVILAIAAGVVVYFIKQGKIKDTDGDFIPDVVEDAIDDVKKTAKEIKRRAKQVKAELEDVVEELQDVKDALKGKVTKSKLRSLSKKSLVEHAKEKFDIELDMSSSKTNLVNNVYSLHHKK